MAKTRRTFTRAFKAEAVRRLAEQGKSLTEVARVLEDRWGFPWQISRERCSQPRPTRTAPPRSGPCCDDDDGEDRHRQD